MSALILLIFELLLLLWLGIDELIVHHEYSFDDYKNNPDYFKVVLEWKFINEVIFHDWIVYRTIMLLVWWARSMFRRRSFDRWGY